MSALDAIKTMRNKDFSDLEQPTEQPEVAKGRSIHPVRVARSVIYYGCFALMLGWNLYCLIFNLPVLVNASTAMAAHSTGNSGSGIGFMTVYAVTLYAVNMANWFFPTVGLGMIALTAKSK